MIFSPGDLVLVESSYAATREGIVLGIDETVEYYGETSRETILAIMEGSIFYKWEPSSGRGTSISHARLSCVKAVRKEYTPEQCGDTEDDI